MLSGSTDHDVPRRLAWLLGSTLVLAVIAAYWNSLTAPLFFDDLPSIVRNESIRHLWPLSDVLNPPANGSGATGRPLVNLSLALNYAAGGLDVRGYHLVNLALHLLATLTLWGLLRRTLRRPSVSAHFRGRPEMVAWSVALLWALHPLLTESVVCVVQRNEVMGGLFYLLTFYAFIRAVETRAVPQAAPANRRAAKTAGLAAEAQAPRPIQSPRFWFTLSVLACFAGVLSKEVIATAPLLLWIFDRTFFAGSFRAAWRERKWFYGALAATWVPLGWLVLHNGRRGGTVGFGLGVTPWEYLLTQCEAITTYCRLSLWPHPLIVDYGRTLAGVGDVWWRGLIVLAMLAATGLALWRKPSIGFLGAWFFVILAPSSSFVPLTTQTIAEHRMYLPLAALVVFAVLGLNAWLNRRATPVVIVLALALGALTVRRNHDYRTDAAIWADTVAKRPDNPRAYDGLAYTQIKAGRWQDAIVTCERARKVDPSYRGDLAMHTGQALMGLGRPAEALPHFEQMLRDQPDNAELLNNAGMALAALHRLPEAIAHYEAALNNAPTLADAHNNLGNALVKNGQLPEALAHYAAAVQLRPDYADAQSNWARSLFEAGRAAEALPHFEAALSLRPGADAHEQLARALLATGRVPEAINHLEIALAMAPESLAARIDLGNAFVASGQFGPAQAAFETALRIQPESAEAHYNLGNLLAQQEHFPDAIAHYQAALRTDPRLVAAHHNLAIAFMTVGRASEALAQFEETLRLAPGSADVHHELALALSQAGRWREAEAHERAALQVRPDFPEARDHLTWLGQQR